MPTLKLNPAAKAAIEANAIGSNHWSDTSVALPDGTFQVPISDDVAERLEGARKPGESDSDLIARLLDAYAKRHADGQHRATASHRFRN